MENFSATFPKLNLIFLNHIKHHNIFIHTINTGEGIGFYFIIFFLQKISDKTIHLRIINSFLSSRNMKLSQIKSMNYKSKRRTCWQRCQTKRTDPPPVACQHRRRGAGLSPTSQTQYQVLNRSTASLRPTYQMNSSLWYGFWIQGAYIYSSLIDMFFM